ncbi:two-component sensor histidine kinase [Hasllibacter halocynthiae]|uniref:histidine kinase n=2 Tax=Hasllibacter halocynthiae TaxID=595589 RepID=A0A2T0X9D4_9RHOB|nr:two-component sensor histidine kinase [Hasllibacter halocynthiae]
MLEGDPTMLQGGSPLRRYGLSIGTTDPDLDRLAALAARMAELPRAAVALNDGRRAHHVGACLPGGSEDAALIHDDPVVPDLIARSPDAGIVMCRDLADDPSFARRPVHAVHGIRFVAAAPLYDADHVLIGALEVAGPEPHELDERARYALPPLARQVMANLELRRIAAAEARAIRALEKQNARLRAALDSERILKMEIDHRVKNSLQMVSSLLQMQGAQSTSGETRAALAAARGRVQAITSIHAALHRVSQMDRVFLPTFGNSLIEELRKGAPENVVLLPRMGAVDLETSQASALAILMNEFIANSLKYAFPDGRDGTVSLDIGCRGGRVRARFEDDGVGHDPAAPRGEGLGTRIMEAVAGQLGAELDFLASPRGTALAFEFPLGARA